MLNRQEVFDIVSTHLLTQMAVSRIPESEVDRNGNLNSCAYRSESGLKCAIGKLIKDEFYTYDLETLNVTHRAVSEALAKSGYEFNNDDHSLVSDTEFLMYLQRIHDTLKPQSWRENLAKSAITYGLEINFNT